MNNNKQFLNRAIYFVIFILIVVGVAYFILPEKPESVVGQQSNNLVNININSSIDSDYDGLSDFVEINTYHTNPNLADTDSDGYLDSAEVLAGSNPLDPTNAAIATESVIKSISLPWYIARAAGIAAYILMFFVIMLGTGMTSGYIYSVLNPVKAWIVHKYISLALGLTLLTHIIALLFDKFMNFGLLDIFIPFFSNFKPWFLSFGILAFYTIIVIIFSSLLFRIKYKRAWRGIHYATYPLFIFSLLHGLFTGTDSNTIGMQIIYWSTGIIFFSLTFYRFILRKK